MTRRDERSQLRRRAVLGAAVAAPAALAFIVAANAVRPDPASETVDLFDFIPAALHAGIRARTVDNSPVGARALAGHIQKAIDTAAAGRRRLIIPAGLYNIAPVKPFASEAGPCRRCFAPRSHMHLQAEPGAIFRIVDRVSTDAAVVFMCMFGSNEQLVDLSWQGLTMDMNGRNNPISPRRRAGDYALLNQAHIYISGTPDGRAANASDVVVERCRFANTPGVSALVLAQSNQRGAALGRGWRIADCQFIDGGLDTPDHSAIFAWADDVVCERCTFANAAAKTAVGGNVAYEVHGSRQRFADNRVSNYYQGVWVDGNRSTEVAGDIEVIGNAFENMSAFGIMFYGTECRTSEVHIAGNAISFNDLTYPGVDLKIGIGCLAPLSQKRVTISNNTVTSASRRTASAGVSLQAPSRRGELHDAFLIEKNSFDRTTFGVQIVTNPVCGIGSVTVMANRSHNLSRAGAFGVPQGIGVDFQGTASTIRSLAIVDNICTDDRGTAAQCAFGIRLQGRVADLRLGGNVASGMRHAPYAEGTLTVANRRAAAS